MVGGVLCACGRTGTPPPFFLLFCLLVCLLCGCGGGCAAKGRRRVWGLCGVVDVGDELLCFVDQGVAEESGTRQQHQHNTSLQYVIEAEPRDR